MGADQFFNRVKKNGKSAKESFNETVEDAQYEEGHGGYTGTIAEKGGFSMSNKPDDVDADEWISKLDDFDEDERDQKNYSELKRDFESYDDKWGDALCIDDGDHFIFCGWASS